MKHNVTFLKRCLALVLALVMVASNANLGFALNAFAVNESKSTTVGELVADSYQLTAAEKALIESGLLKGDGVVTYNVPGDEDGLVTINPEEKTVKVASFGNWTPAEVQIIANNTAVETITDFNNGVAAYTYDGDAFTAQVKLVLNHEVDKEVQENMLNAAAYLKNGMNNLAVIGSVDSNLETVRDAVGSFATVIATAESYRIGVSDSFKEAVDVLEAQVAKHGTLTLCVLDAEYESTVKYMVENAAEWKAALVETYEALYAIENDPLYNNSILSEALRTQEPAAHTKWNGFKGILDDLMGALKPVYEDSWGCTKDLLKADVDYTVLATLLAGISETNEYTVTNTTLHVADAVVRKSQDLVNVTVKVVLKVVENAVDSDTLVVFGEKTEVLGFPQNAHDYDIQNAVNDKKIVENAIAAWGDAYVAGGYEAEWSELPERLTEDVTLTITYVPKMYEVEGQLSGSYPYGYQLTLPAHADAAKAYDYTIGGELYRQGEVYTITGPVIIEREEVKAYSTASLYAVIASSFGNATAQAVMSTGALKGDEVIYYRTPDVAEGDMHLEDNVLSVRPAYTSGYHGLMWVPYTFGHEGVENDFTGNVVDWNGRVVNVRYALYLDTDAAKVSEAVAMAEALSAEYELQTTGMSRLLAQKAELEDLPRSYIAGLNGVIADYIFVDDKAKNQELRDYFIDVITRMLDRETGCMTDGSGYMNILAMINDYNVNGMSYYYKNSEKVRAEVMKLSGYMTDLVGDDDQEKMDALAKLLNDPQGLDRPDLVSKLADLEADLKSISEQLVLTNPAIDVNSANLSKLISALDKGTVSMGNYASGKAPYIVSENILVQDDSAVVLVADIIIDGVKTTITGSEYDKWSKLDDSMVAELQKLVNEKLAVLNDVAKYYDINNDVAAQLNQYLGQEMTDNLYVVVTADAKEYTVKIDGEADQTITINDLEINLPAFDNGSDVITWVYVYTVDGVELDALQRSYTFTAEQIDRLFANGTYTIERTKRNEAERRLNAALEVLNDNTAGNTFEVVNGVMYANITPSGAGLEAFFTGLLESGYGYIGLNGEAFVYENDKSELEISIQTLVNAVLNDNTFSNQTLIDLGNNNGGKFVVTNMQLGADENTLFADNMGFVLSLNSVTSQMVKLANGLEAVKNYVSFQSVDGVMTSSLTLPEKVYEVYLTALLVAGKVDTDDMNAVNNEIAFMFLYDYVDLILGNDAITTETFQNTLEIMDSAVNLVGKDLPNKDLTAYEDAYQLVRDIYKNVEVVVAGEAPVTITVNSTASGLNQVIDALGIDLSNYGAYLGMVKELNEENEGIVLTATATAVLENTTVDFEALIVDLDEGVEGAKDAIDAVRNDGIKEEIKDNVRGNGLANSIDYTTDLFGRVSEVTGPAAIYLLSDVTGDLVIEHTTVLDLNGHTINGNVTVKSGELYIVDSKIATTDCGGVTGNVTGDVNIVAGTYNADVSAYLKDGYKQVNGTVQNAMYTIEREGKEFVLVLNSDFMEDACVEGYLPSIRYLGAEIAIDMAMNFYIPANLNAEGNRIYGIDDRFADLIGLTQLSVGELFDKGLECVDAKGIAAFANIIIHDMMQFGDIADAIENETVLASYTLETNPFAVEIKHAADGDYMTVGIVAADEVSKDVTLSLKVVGDNIKRVVALLRELDKIVVYEESNASISLEQPIRDGKTIILEGGANASLSLDLTVHGDDGFDKDDYKNILAVVFAYGTPAKAQTLVNAIGNDKALNAAFNDMTVREVIKSLDAMSRTTSFTEMAQAVGADGLISDTADNLEALYHLIACGAGKMLGKLEELNLGAIADNAEDAAEKVLEKLELTTLKPVLGMAGNVVDKVIAKVDLDSKLGALDQGDGTYLLSYTYSRSGNVDYRGYGADLTLTKSTGTLKVKIFEEVDCLWGDANHDNVVDAKDATLVLQYSVDTVAEGQFFCTKRTDVNGDGKIDAKDATLILQHSVGTITKFPVEE